MGSGALGLHQAIRKKDTMIQDHPRDPRKKLVCTASPDTACKVARYLRETHAIDAHVFRFKETGEWCHVVTKARTASLASIIADAFTRGMTAGLDQHYGRPDFEEPNDAYSNDCKACGLEGC